MSPALAGCHVPVDRAQRIARASVACPSLGETGPSSMTIVADFRSGIGPIPGAYWRDGKDHRLSHRHRRRCGRSGLFADASEKKLR